jgi:hypothetical protein
MKSALVVGAPCDLGAVAEGGETDCCALALIAANAQRVTMWMQRFISLRPPVNLDEESE